MTKEIKVSVIIPCYNSGKYLEEAIFSVLHSGFQDFEVIVINDGSFDIQTLQILNRLRDLEFVSVFNKGQGGPASARNLGVVYARGEFLLFLDSDNRIQTDFLNSAVQVIHKNCQLGVVYAKPVFFGFEGYQESNRFYVRDYSFDALLSGNYVDMCSLVRKKAFLEVGGFDESQELFFGEDWDLWIRIAQAGWKFYFLDKVLFDYRIRKGSLMDQVDAEKRDRTLHYLGTKHGFLIHQRYRQYFRVLEKIQAKPFTYFLRILYYKYILRKSLLD